MKYPQLVSMPSAVSDWLEEQLEARGIDAVVYTRYILSLFHRDSLDFFGSETDYHSKVKLGGSRKRLRRSAECCNHVHVNAEQLKRSAAVECLMSASDQNSGIETLVDELCEKLKEIESKNTTSKIDAEKVPESESSDILKPPPEQKLSPNDLAKKYYAAFPPLSRNTANLITLIPKWFESPNKKKSPRKTNVQKRSNSCDENSLHKSSKSELVEAAENNNNNNMKNGRNLSKQRLSYFSRNKKELGYSRTMAKSLERAEGLADWDVYMYERDANVAVNINEDDDAKQMEAKLAAKFDSSLEDLWKNEEADKMEIDTYEGLPVDIQDLLASPPPQDVSVELLNWANKQDLNKRSFIQCGTNITSSIWSDNAATKTDDDFDKSLYENLYNGALEAEFRGKFNLWSSDNETNENKANFTYEYFGGGEEQQQNSGGGVRWNFQYTETKTTEKWSDAIGDMETSYKFVSDSLTKLNHNREFSSFKEVVPKINKSDDQQHVTNDSVLGVSVMSNRDSTQQQSTNNVEEDLLTSAQSHFRPINSLGSDASVSSNATGIYVDGTTFIIPSNLDQINYKRSPSGSMYLESETGGSPKKIMCYKNDRESEIWNLIEPEFVLKFTPCQNDKSCQTDILDGSFAEETDVGVSLVANVKSDDRTEPDDFFFPGDNELLNNNLENCEFYTTDCPTARADSMTAEIIWDGGEKKCDRCKINDWFKNRNKTSEANKGRNIWNVEVCGDCLGVTAGRAPSGRSLQYCQLREELSQDGEQLLSDLSCLQRVYMENVTDIDSWQQITEEENPASSWSNFTFVKKDCILEVPTLRSVTL